jgi:hypothetical protein
MEAMASHVTCNCAGLPSVSGHRSKATEDSPWVQLQGGAKPHAAAPVGVSLSASWHRPVLLMCGDQPLLAERGSSPRPRMIPSGVSRIGWMLRALAGPARRNSRGYALGEEQDGWSRVSGKRSADLLRR